MSRNSKNARNIARRKAISLMHKNGEKGPSRTAAKHGKRWTYRSNPDVAKRIAEMMKATSEGEATSKEKTSGKAILRKAGGASKSAESDN